ncbi:hypothetical protein [Oceanicella sp. SM1341]|uniref:hypothetical protein n=1 Tax=Oceanicella sp. SM1341 TaxID=1548889 RepID=UPI000E47AD69|nr:hypothetical protein [Oceanicella sp. SM1341]
MPDRRALLCQQPAPPALTGIDFVQVLDHTVQTVLRVFFIIDPDRLETPGTGLPAIPEAAAFGPADLSALSLASTAGGAEVEILRADWLSVTVDGLARTVLEIEVEAPGDFTLYRVALDHPGVDRFFAAATFSFKQACPTGLDCKGCCHCSPEALRDVAVDYLARDWSSLRRALLDFAAAEFPEWEHRVEADQAMMLLEILAALGDEFAYLQDAYALEATLATASQTQSVLDLARLVDYAPDRGAAATTPLLLTLGPGAERWSEPGDPRQAIAPDLAFAAREDVGAIPFRLAERVFLHPAWNAAPLYQPDSGTPCLPAGATEAWLSIAPPVAGQLPPEVVFADPADIWLGRRAVLRSGLGRPEEPDRAHALTITEVEGWTDPLDPASAPLTRIAWAEPLPFQVPVAFAAVYLNAVEAEAGETVEETFRIGPDSALAQRFAGADAGQMRALTALPRATERQGACSGGQRGRVLRYGLLESPVAGLSWRGQAPVLTLLEITPDLSLPQVVDFAPDPASELWDFTPRITDADAEDRAFTVEAGLWREVLRFRRPAGDVVHRDYAGDAGFSLRFGDRDFGIAPADGTVFRAIYLSAPGLAANLPADTITRTARPGGDGTPTLPGVTAVTNPFPVTSARAPESVESIRANAPEAWRAVLLRAVRPEDYREILGRRPDLQAARATPRFTGSWTTDFVSVDPVGAQTLSPALRASVEAEIDCIRQAGRQVCLRDAHYLALDIRIEVCAAPEASNSRLVRRITRALADFRDASAFFHPDRLSFGDDLLRSRLIARVHAVEGVRAVESVQVRRRGLHGFRELEAVLPVAPHQILQLSNDPAHPERGHLEVSVHGGG